MTQDDPPTGSAAYETAKSGNPIENAVLDNAAGTGPEIGLTVNTNDVVEGSAFTVTVTDTTGILAAQGAATTQVKVEVDIDGLPAGSVVKWGSVTLTPNSDGNYEVILTKGAPLASLTVTVGNDPADGGGSIEVSIVKVDDNGYFETVTVEVVAPESITVTDVVPDSLGLSIYSQVDSVTNEMAYTIALAAAGPGFDTNANQAVGEAISFELNVNGMTSGQIASVIGQLDGISNVSAVDMGGGNISVTLESGYVHTDDLGFSLPIDSFAAGSEADIEVGIGTIASSPDYLSVDSDHGTAVNHVIAGTAGGDTLIGTDGDDFIIGGDGNDIIVSGDGDDIMFGGNGADTFTFDWSAKEGDNHILDYNKSEGDVIMLQDLASDDNGALDVMYSDDGNGNLQLMFESGTTITFANISYDDAVNVGVENMINFVDDEGNHISATINFMQG